MLRTSFVTGVKMASFWLRNFDTSSEINICNIGPYPFFNMHITAVCSHTYQGHSWDSTALPAAISPKTVPDGVVRLCWNLPPFRRLHSITWSLLKAVGIFSGFYIRASWSGCELNVLRWMCSLGGVFEKSLDTAKECLYRFGSRQDELTGLWGCTIKHDYLHMQLSSYEALCFYKIGSQE